MSSTSREKKNPRRTQKDGEGTQHRKGHAVRKRGVPEDDPHGRTAKCRATKKPSDKMSEGFGNKCTAENTAYTQTLVASGNPAAMERSLGRKLCVPAFQSGMPFKALFYRRITSSHQQKWLELQTIPAY